MTPPRHHAEHAPDGEHAARIDRGVERIRHHVERNEKKADAEAARASRAETVQTLLRIGTAAIGAGVLAFLFGSYIGISKLTAMLVVGVGLIVSASAPWLVNLVEIKWILVSIGCFLALDLMIFIGLKTWGYLKPKPNDAAPKS